MLLATGSLWLFLLLLSPSYPLTEYKAVHNEFKGYIHYISSNLGCHLGHSEAFVLFRHRFLLLGRLMYLSAVGKEKIPLYGNSKKGPKNVNDPNKKVPKNFDDLDKTYPYDGENKIVYKHLLYSF